MILPANFPGALFWKTRKYAGVQSAESSNSWSFLFSQLSKECDRGTKKETQSCTRYIMHMQDKRKRLKKSNRNILVLDRVNIQVNFLKNRSSSRYNYKTINQQMQVTETSIFNEAHNRFTILVSSVWTEHFPYISLQMQVRQIRKHNVYTVVGTSRIR